MYYKTSLTSYSVTFSFWLRPAVSAVTQDVFVDSVKIVCKCKCALLASYSFSFGSDTSQEIFSTREFSRNIRRCIDIRKGHFVCECPLRKDLSSFYYLLFLFK